MFSALRKHTRPLARFGCVSIGTVYVLVGILALLALFGTLIGQADEDRMVHVLQDLPGGVVLIWGIVIGMFGYVVWRVIEALADPYEFGSDWMGLAKRAAVALSGLGYGFLAFSAARIATGNGGNGGDESEEEQQLLVAQILEWPAGAWLVGGAGIVVIAVAVLQIGMIVRQDYMLEVDNDAMAPRMLTLTHVLAGSGYAARSVILGVLGYFLVRGALTSDPEEVGDTDTAFDFIGGGWVGDSAFFLVAAGTIAYGVYMYLCAAYYKFQRH